VVEKLEKWRTCVVAYLGAVVEAEAEGAIDDEAQGMQSEAKALLTAARSMRAASVDKRKSPRRHCSTGRRCMVRCRGRGLTVARGMYIHSEPTKRECACM
jgi:hypothetical protein